MQYTTWHENQVMIIASEVRNVVKIKGCKMSHTQQRKLALERTISYSMCEIFRAQFRQTILSLLSLSFDI